MARLTDVMWIGRYERLRTRTFVLSTDIAPRARYTRVLRMSKPPGLAAACMPARGSACLPAEDRPAGGTRLVQTREARAMGRVAQQRGVGAGLFRDRQERVHEGVERLLRLRLRRLDHERPLHHQREVDRGGVEPVI